MLIMVGGFILLNQKGWVDIATNKDQTTTPPPFLVDLDSNSVYIITYTLTDSDEVVIQRTDDNNWIINFEGGFVTAGIVEQFISAINSIKPTVVLEIAPDGAATGLDKPNQILSIKLDNGTEHVIKIGNLNPIQTGYYIQIDLGKVVLLNKGSLESLIAIIQNAQYPPSPTPTSIG